MLMVIDLEKIKFYGGHDFLKIKIPFIYYSNDDIKLGGVYEVEKKDGNYIEKIEWNDDYEYINHDFDEIIIKKIDYYLHHYKFYNDLLKLDITLDKIKL